MAERAEKAFISGGLEYIVHPEWRGRLELETSGQITSEDIRAVEEAVLRVEMLLPLALKGIVAGIQGDDMAQEPATLSEARAMLAEVTAERDALCELVERLRVRARAAEEAGGKAYSSLAILRDHDQRGLAALREMLGAFPVGDGWVRSVSVSPDDMNRWRNAAVRWEGE